MMSRLCLATIFALVAALTLGSSTAHAAKGVKKKNKAHTIHGTVVAVNHKAGKGTITIMARQHKKKNAAAGNAPQMHEVTVHIDTATAYSMSQKKAKTPTTVAAVQKGAKIMVKSTGQHADTVVVSANTKKAKKNALNAGKKAKKVL